MKVAEETIYFANHQLVLNNQRSIYWPEQKALILSDIHLGKSAYFRKNGFAVPSFFHKNDLQRLEELIIHYQVENVYIVGDFIHAGANDEVLHFKTFTENYTNCSFHLIKGNHDKVSTDFLKTIGLKSVENISTIQGITLVHEPNAEGANYSISGHFHPGVNIPMLKKTTKRLPCFVILEKCIILPAFSKFTGLDTNKTFENAIFYCIHDEGIFKV